MSKSTPRKLARKGRSSIPGPSGPTVEPSGPLPLPTSEELTTVPPIEVDSPKPLWYLPPDSKVRKTALTIAAMRLAGMDDDEIAKALQISRKSIGPYLYRAGKNGWLSFDEPTHRVEYDLMHTAVDNLKNMLSNDKLVADKTIRHETTMEMLKSTLFKKMGEPEAVAQVQQTMVAIKILMPEGPVQTMRDDTTGGIPAYVLDAEPVK